MLVPIKPIYTAARIVIAVSTSNVELSLFCRVMGLWTGLQLLLVVCTALTDADFVCNHCDCYGTTINCTARNLEHHPNASEWPTDMVVTDVVMDNNGLVHVTQYPPMAVLHLSLSHNRIVRIDGEAFLHLPNLTELDLSHNEITSDNLIADVFKVKLPSSQDEFVY
jgi:hypothetical protein